MANSKQAIKRARQNTDKYKLRHAQRSVVRTAVKKVRADIESQDKDKALESFQILRDKFQLRTQIQYFLYETIQYYFLYSRIINVLSQLCLIKYLFYSILSTVLIFLTLLNE